MSAVFYFNSILMLCFIFFAAFTFYKSFKNNKSYSKKAPLFKAKLSKKSLIFPVIYASIIILDLVLIIADGDLIEHIPQIIFFVLNLLFVIDILVGKLIITEDGVGIKGIITNALTCFIPWDKVKYWKWNKFDENSLYISGTIEKNSREIEKKFSSLEKEKINTILFEHIPEKVKFN